MTLDDRANGAENGRNEVENPQPGLLQQDVLWEGSEWLKTDTLDFTAPEPEPLPPPPEKKRGGVFRVLRNAMAVFGAAVLVFLVFIIATNAGSLGVLAEVLALIKSQSLYADRVDTGGMILGATEGIVATLDDPYSYYMDPEQWQQQMETLDAEFAGIGAYLSLSVEGQLIVVGVIPDTPAERAGLVTGDVILTVDGVEVQGINLDEATTLVRGDAGTDVTLTLMREGEVLNFVITREIVEVPSASGEMLANNVGYIYLAQFHSKSAEEIRKLTEELQAEGATALILDLRDNGGGDYYAALDIADYFLDDKDVVQIANAGGVQYLEHTNPGANGIPLLVLVDGGTASASEVLASGLQDNARALLIGTQTFGKGIIQVLYPLRDSGALRLTTNEYLSLKGEKIHGVGLTPDFVVEATPEDETDVVLEYAEALFAHVNVNAGQEKPAA